MKNKMMIIKLKEIDDKLSALFKERFSLLKKIFSDDGFVDIKDMDFLDDGLSSFPNDSLARDIMQELWRNIRQASFDMVNIPSKGDIPLVSRLHKASDTVIKVGTSSIGDGIAKIIAGPCSVESEEQIFAVAEAVYEQGLTFLRGGAFKPRTSPYDFQGLGQYGWVLLRQAADAYGLYVVSELMSVEHLDQALKYVDIIQVGARNMYNYPLLCALGEVDRPILLKRGISATINEWLMAAEYVLARGNQQVILCERGIRSYESSMRNTLDLAAVASIKQESHLPIIVDVSHATGRKDLILPCAKAALAVGADGLMIEIHPKPFLAKSDAQQQLSLSDFKTFIKAF